MIGNKWQLFDKVSEDLDMMHEGMPPEYQQHIEGLANRMARVADLKNKLDEE